MTKEEILEKSRSDNAGKDIEDLEVQKTAATIAYFSSFGLCVLVSILNWIFTRQIKIECWIVFFGMVCVAFFVKFARLRKLHELFVALGYLLIFAALLVLFILQLSGKIGTYSRSRGMNENLVLQNHLKEIRTEKKLSQSDLAQMVGVSRNTISSIETLQFCPTAKLALILCVALDKKFEDIFYFE